MNPLVKRSIPRVIIVYMYVCVCVWILVLSNDDGRCDGQAYNYVQSRRVFNRHYKLRKYNIPYPPPNNDYHMFKFFV